MALDWILSDDARIWADDHAGRKYEYGKTGDLPTCCGSRCGMSLPASLARFTGCDAVEGHGNIYCRIRFNQVCFFPVFPFYRVTTCLTFLPHRTLGGTIGISIGDTIFTTELSKRLARIPNLASAGVSAAGTVSSFAGLSQIQPPDLRQQVLHAYTRSLSTIWIVSVPLAFFGLLCVSIVREYSLKRQVDRGTADGAAKANPAVVAEKSEEQ